MTARVFALPDLGEGLTEAELVHWLVAIGDTVRIDQPIAEVETAKSIVEVPSPYAGVIEKLHGEEGDTLDVGAPFIEVREPADDAAAPAQSSEPDAAAPAAAGSGSGHVLVGYGTSDIQHSARRRRGRASTVTAAPAAPAAATAPAAAAAPVTGIVPVISPVVRTLARTHGVDLSTIRPTGDGGVVTRRDVEQAFATQAEPAMPGTEPASAPTSAPADGAPADSRTGLAIAATTPFSLFRRTVAANMTRSRSEIPEATVWVDVDATELWDARKRIRLGDRTPSLLSFVARFTLAALARRPELAGRVTASGDGLETFEGVNLGFAVDSPRGLVVPVVRRADRMTIRELDAAFDRLTRQAREGSLAPAELTGSTFTINNYGSLGVDGSAAIINHPEVAILGIGRMIERPWVVDGAVVPRRIAQLSLVFDHRVTDGGVAAGMLREVADAVESPLALLADAPPA
ncbi:dihydrolipoamide acetyltransferase family protein [Leifsonia poae]|uniref:Dihydrolipoamide acetyltransferase component of pyruvate dehydrogenase complex n=1 Tax=Leifsonia poae TaxID=110933 RepID=A0A9W6LY33_9MICO|nr:dihydrolipoamide acetyltransferase family protein [Leifsonia poae]GLJ74788.1 dihydrolipoamide acetyltransferase component of pyruvate dehydrogenase complex [Leifsonia poae]